MKTIHQIDTGNRRIYFTDQDTAQKVAASMGRKSVAVSLYEDYADYQSYHVGDLKASAMNALTDEQKKALKLIDGA